MRFSIIVPVYNVEKYIVKCLDSLVNQSFEDYEIIVVNDETPDRSMDLVRPYQEKYPDKIHVIHQKNTGQGGARNNAVAIAKGDYLLFVDSDDYVRVDALQILDTCLCANPCDLLMFNYAEVKEDGNIIREIKIKGDPNVLREPLSSPEILLESHVPCNKAYRRAFYLDCGVSFPEKTLFEDSVIRIFMGRAQSVGVCRECLYYYVQHANSTMHKKISPQMLDIIKVSDIVFDALHKARVYEQCKEHMDAVLVLDVYSRICRINAFDYKNPIQKPLVDYIMERYPNHQSNSVLSPAIKKELACLCKYEFMNFYYRYSLVRKAKKALLQFPFVAKLNVLRRRILGKI